MKKIALPILILALLVNAHAQLVEQYENPQRFEFSGFSDHQNMRSYNSIAPNRADGSNDFNAFFCRKYSLGSHRLIYGIAIPINTCDLLPAYHYFSNVDAPERWHHLINYYDTSGCSVILGNATQAAGYDYELLTTAHIRLGEAALIGNYFKMPDADSAAIRTYAGNSTYFPVIEVYFNQPQYVSGDYIVGCNLAPDHIPYIIIEDYGCLHLSTGPMIFVNVGSVAEELTLASINDNSFINTYNNIYGFYNISNFGDSWGGPFPIVTPPPCMPPVRMGVKEQHRQGATIEWRAQYANSFFEVEYGLQGFDEGTGVTVDSITPDANYFGRVTLDSLQMDADYTVRVRSYCDITGGYSDWTEIDFHTDQYYLVSTSVNDDSCGYVKGGGWHIADTTIRLYAYPKNQSPFLNWSDGSTQNPRVVTVTCDTSFHANFQCSGSSEVIALADMHKASPYIHPNPTDGITTIRSNSAITSWILYDMQGKTLMSGTPNSKEFNIDFSNLTSAIYILQIGTSGGTIMRKIVKR